MATNVTLATLFGTESRYDVISEEDLDDKMEFAFSGFNSVFLTGMGSRGRRYAIAGLLRGSASGTQGAAADSFNGLLNNPGLTGIEDYKARATLLTFSGDTSADATLVRGTSGAQLDNVVIEVFQLTEPRRFSREGNSYRVSAAFHAVLRKLI